MTRHLDATERNAIRNALEACAPAIEGIYANYSGRFMYGAKCFGIITNDPFLVVGSISMSLGDAGLGDLAVDLYSNTCIDDMGMSKIIYFPDVDWNADDPENVESFFEPEEEDW